MIELALRHAFGDFRIDVSLRSDVRVLALFGPSGAGKTRLLDAIAGLFAPQEGRIAIDGEVLLDTARGIAQPAARRRIGYVFQDGRLFPHLDVRANLRYGLRDGSADVTAIVELLGLGPLLARRPATLSGGERQRVAIGRALLSAPRALLLDEPLTGLHAEARAQVLDYLRRLKRELRVAAVLVSHHADEVAALADEVACIEDGRVLAQLDAAGFGLARGGAPATPPAAPPLA